MKELIPENLTFSEVGHLPINQSVLENGDRVNVIEHGNALRIHPGANILSAYIAKPL